MAADRARADLAEPFRVIHKPEVFLDLDVPHVVPVTELRRIQLVEQRGQLAFARDFFVAAATFHPEPDIFFRGIFGDPFKRIFHALQIRRGLGLTCLHRLHFQADIFARKHFAFLRQREKLIGDRVHLHLTAMEDDKRRAEALREVDGLERVANGALAFLRVGGRDFVAIRRRLHDFHRQGTEIVQTAEFHFACLEHFLDARHERNPNAVAQLDAIETEILDLTQHLVAGGMAPGIPAGGERYHRAKLDDRRGLGLGACFDCGGRLLAARASRYSENQDGQRSVNDPANDQGNAQADQVCEGRREQTSHGC